jgi:hypothetical protein
MGHFKARNVASFCKQFLFPDLVLVHSFHRHPQDSIFIPAVLSKSNRSSSAAIAQMAEAVHILQCFVND